MEGTGMVSGKPVPQEGRKLWQYLATISANSDLMKRNITMLVKSGVCALHFAEDAFLTPGHLKTTAVPVEYNIASVLKNSFDIMDHDQSGINDSSFTSNSSFHEQPIAQDNPRMTDGAMNDLNKVNRLVKENHALRKELRVLKKKFTNGIDREKRAKASADKFNPKRKDIRKMVLSLSDLSPGAKAMICWQLHEANAPFSKEEKNLAKLLHYHSPVGMSRLRQAGCNFPSSSTMKRWAMDYDIRPGFTDSIFHALGEKLSNLPADQRLLSLIFDETKIKSMEEYSESMDQVEGLVDLGPLGRRDQRATDILVFSIESINAKKPYRQPIAYVLSHWAVPATDLSVLVKICLDKLAAIGADVRMICCDQGGPNQKLYNTELKVTPEEPHFVYKDKLYYAVCDFPHLIKRLAAFFREGKDKSKMIYQNGEIIAAWDDFVETLRVDCATEAGSNLLSYITERHIQPKTFESMNVKRAFQLFSNRFSCAIETAGTSGLLKSTTWKASSDFAKKMNAVIDACNSYSLKVTVGGKRVLSDRHPDIEQLLREFVDQCESWSTTPNGKKQLPFQRGMEKITDDELYLAAR